MAIEIYLPCVLFKIRIRPGDAGLPTDLEQAVLYFILSREPAGGAHVVDIEQFTGLGPAILMDLLIDFLNRRWIQLQPDGRLFVFEGVKGILRNPQELSRLGSTEHGITYVLAYDLVTGCFGTLLRRDLISAVAGEGVLPRTRSDTGDGYQSLGYPKDLEGFRKEADWEPAIIRALKHAGNKNRNEYLPSLLEGKDSVEIEAPMRPLTFSDDLYFYRASYNITKLRNGDDLAVEFAEDSRNATIRRFGRAVASSLKDISIEAKENGDASFLSRLNRAAQGVSFEARPAQTPMRQLTEMLQDKVRQDFDEVRELWDIVQEEILDLCSNRLDLDISRALTSQISGAALSTIASAARKRLLINSPRVSDSSDGLQTVPQCLLETTSRTLAVRSRDPSSSGFSVLAVTLDSEYLHARRGLDRIRTRLGSNHLVVGPATIRHLSTPFVLQDATGFALLANSPFDKEPLTGIALRVPEATQPLESRTITAFIQQLPETVQSRLIDGHHRDNSKSRNAAVPRDVQASLDELSQRFSEAAPSQTEEMIEQLAWLETWAEKFSDSFEVLVGADIATTALNLIRTTRPDERLGIAVAGHADCSNVAMIPDLLVKRLYIQEKDPPNATARTFVGLPRSSGVPSDPVELARARIGENFRNLEPRCRLFDSAGKWPISFVVGGGAMVLALDNILGSIPINRRPNKGLQVGVLLRGYQACQIGLDGTGHGFPGIAEFLDPIGEMSILPRPVATAELNDLIRRWQSESWEDDGNCGGTLARVLLDPALDLAQDGQLSDWRAAVAALHDAQDRSDQTIRRRVAYSIGKAAAFLGLAGMPGFEGAPLALVETWLAERRLLPAALLVQALPQDAHPLKPAYVAKLVLALARKVPVALSQHELSAVADADQLGKTLIVLLLLDGLGGSLPTMVRYSAYGQANDTLANLMHALGHYAEVNPSAVADLGHLRAGQGDGRFDDIRARIISLTQSERERRGIGIHKLIEYTHHAMYQEDGAFLAELDNLLRLNWEALGEKQRRIALESLLSGKLGDLRIDLMAAASATATSINVERLIDSYFDRKNTEMQARYREVPLNIGLAGRHLFTTLERVMKLVVGELVPILITHRNEADKELTVAVQQFLDKPPSRLGDGLGWVSDALLLRLNDVSATEFLRESAWNLPLARSMQPDSVDWNKLAASILSREFVADNLSDVIGWFLPRKGVSHDDDDHQRLIDLYDLIEDPAISEFDRRNAIGLSEARLRESLDLKSSGISQMATVLQRMSRDDGAFASSASQFEQLAAAAKDALARHDLATTVLQMADMFPLHTAARTEFEKQVAEYGEQAKQQFADDVIKSQIDLLLDRAKGYARAEGFERAFNLYLEIPAIIARYQQDGECIRSIRIGDNPSIVRDFAAGRGDWASQSQPNARDLLTLVIVSQGPQSAALNAADRSASDIAEAVMLFFFGAVDSAALLPIPRMERRVWKIRLSGADVAVFVLSSHLHDIEIWLPTSEEAEIEARTELAKAKSDVREGTLLLARFLSDDIRGGLVLTRRDLARAGLMDMETRRLFLVAALSGRRGLRKVLLNDWWSTQKNADQGKALSLILGIAGFKSHVASADDPVQQLPLEHLAPFLARLAHAFALGTTESSGYLSVIPEAQVIAICRNLERFAPLDKTSVVGVQIPESCLIELVASLFRGS
jgi:hypothetical protein